jgi:hypothetical protein
MAITLNGTTGITTPDVNSDGLTVDSTTLVVDEANDRVGIGTSSPVQKEHLDGGSGDTYLQFSNSTTGATSSDGSRIGIASADNTLRIQNLESASIRFDTNNTERMRINSGGQVNVNTTGNTDALLVVNGGGNHAIRTLRDGTASATQISFANANGTVGSITTNGSATAYNTSSDYRLKENVVGVTGAAARVQQLNPVRFNFITDPDTTVDGFLAHEVQDVVPEAITGTKDAVDAEGNPEYQGIDQSKLVPLLTAALQEALTKIETLEARVAALEAA